MCHELHHEDISHKLEKVNEERSISLELSYDGLCIPIDL